MLSEEILVAVHTYVYIIVYTFYSVYTLKFILAQYCEWHNQMFIAERLYEVMRLIAAPTYVSRYKVSVMDFNSFFIEVDDLLPVMLVNVLCHTIRNYYR